MRSILVFTLFLPLLTLAQPISPLDRMVSVEMRNERVSEVLRQVSQQANFAFSYNPAVVNDTRTVTLRTGRQPVRVVLAQLFQGQMVIWKVRGNHVVLLGEGETKREPTHFFLDGYITDGQTGQKIASASIYERTSLASTVSNPYGYYRLKLARDLPTNARVEVRKRQYLGESVSVSSRQSRTVDVRLRAVSQAQPPTTPPVASLTTATVATVVSDTLTPQPEPTPTLAQADTTRPILADSLPSQIARADSLPGQIDSLPAQIDSPPSTQRPSGREQVLDLINQVSAVAQQLIHRQNLDADTLYRPFQLSVFPYIGTNHRLSNHVINHLSVNLFMGTALGVTGLEAGAFINLIRADVRGGQFAGFGNVVGRNVYGIQAAGFFNKTRGEVHGLQLAGFSNRSGDLRHGIQIAGFVNHARHVTNSLQIGVINTAESTNSVPIGLLSFVRQNGYRRWEVAANETFPVNLTFRTGVKWFYNLLTIGAIPANQAWQVGYGLGTGVGLGRTVMATLEVSSHLVGNAQLNQTFGQGAPSTLFRATALLEKRFGRLALAAGPTLSFYNTGAELDNPDKNPLATTRLRIQNSPLVSSLPFTNNGWASWFGWQVGVRWAN